MRLTPRSTLLALLLPLAVPLLPAAQAATGVVAGDVAGDELSSLNDRARAALDSNQPGEAVELLERAHKLDPSQEVIRKNLAWAYFRRGQLALADYRLDQAGADYRRAVELNPAESGYQLHLAQLLVRRYKLDDAEKVLSELLANSPDNLDGWLVMGDVASLQDDLPAAQAAYEKAAASTDTQLAELARAAADRTARQYAVEKDYRTDMTPFFVIRGPAQSEGPLMSVRLANVLDRARASVCASLNVSTQRKATVVLYPPESFRQVTGTHDWVGGLFDRKIRLPIADVERDLPLIEGSFRHEFTHLLVSELNPGCPVFLNEGLAEFMGEGRGNGMAKLAEYLDSHHLSRDSVPRIQELPPSFMEISDSQQVAVAYLLSYAFVDHVVQYWGIEAVKEWMVGVGSKPLDQAYQAATGRTLEAEETLFREHLRKVAPAR